MGIGDAGTHPSAIERIERISVRNLLLPKQLEMDQEFNHTVVRIMNAVSSVVSSFNDARGKKLLSEMRRTLSEVR